MKQRGMRAAAMCLAGALIVSSAYGVTAGAKAKKVAIKGKKKVTMTVGAKKKFKANQKVKWMVKGKSVKIVKGKKAKAVTVQAKKKGLSTLTAKKGKKKASVKIQVTKKGTTTEPGASTNENSQTVTDMTKLTNSSFYKVTKVDGDDITVVCMADNKEYTTKLRSDIPVWRENNVVGKASEIQAGEYFKCCANTFDSSVTTYAAIVIPEKDYQTIVSTRTSGNSLFDCNVGVFYIVENTTWDLKVASSKDSKNAVVTIYLDEDTEMLWANDSLKGSKLQPGMRVLYKYGYVENRSDGKQAWHNWDNAVLIY